jgi:hypothetical protein
VQGLFQHPASGPCVHDSMKIITEGKNEKNRGHYQTVQTG